MHLVNFGKLSKHHWAAVGESIKKLNYGTSVKILRCSMIFGGKILCVVCSLKQIYISCVCESHMTEEMISWPLWVRVKG